MDASQITKLRQKQQTRYVNPSQIVDSSTLTWKNVIQSSTHLSSTVPTSSKQTNLMTGSTQRFPDVLSGASGSAGRFFSSDAITLQKAGKRSCAIPSTMPVIVHPACYCDQNGPTSANPITTVNNQSNPYLPPFDTYYLFKQKCFKPKC
jgi:hypothetical protein